MLGSKQQAVVCNYLVAYQKVHYYSSGQSPFYNPSKMYIKIITACTTFPTRNWWPIQHEKATIEERFFIPMGHSCGKAVSGMAKDIYFE